HGDHRPGLPVGLASFGLAPDSDRDAGGATPPAARRWWGPGEDLAYPLRGADARLAGDIGGAEPLPGRLDDGLVAHFQRLAVDVVRASGACQRVGHVPQGRDGVVLHLVLLPSVNPAHSITQARLTVPAAYAYPCESALTWRIKTDCNACLREHAHG